MEKLWNCVFEFLWEPCKVVALYVVVDLLLLPLFVGVLCLVLVLLFSLFVCLI